MYKDQYFSILGDSISTLSGWIPEGNESYYGWHRREAQIFWSEQTWWGKVLKHFGGKLLVNESWSACLVSRQPGMEIPSYGCSDERTGNLGVDDQLPDQILVFIGTNDKGWGIPLYSADPADLSAAGNAYGTMLDKLRRNYPQAQIWCMTMLKTSATTAWRASLLEEYSQMIRTAAGDRGCRVIELPFALEDWQTVDDLHPNEAGMELIAEAVIRAME